MPVLNRDVLTLSDLAAITNGFISNERVRAVTLVDHNKLTPQLHALLGHVSEALWRRLCFKGAPVNSARVLLVNNNSWSWKSMITTRTAMNIHGRQAKSGMLRSSRHARARLAAHWSPQPAHWLPNRLGAENNCVVYRPITDSSFWLHSAVFSQSASSIENRRRVGVTR